MYQNNKMLLTLLCSTLFLLISLKVVEARRGSPLLVEEDGSSRRNRPAGKCYKIFEFLLHFLCYLI